MTYHFEKLRLFSGGCYVYIYINTHYILHLPFYRFHAVAGWMLARLWSPWMGGQGEWQSEKIRHHDWIIATLRWAAWNGGEVGISIRRLANRSMPRRSTTGQKWLLGWFSGRLKDGPHGGLDNSVLTIKAWNLKLGEDRRDSDFCW